MSLHMPALPHQNGAAPARAVSVVIEMAGTGAMPDGGVVIGLLPGVAMTSTDVLHDAGYHPGRVSVNPKRHKRLRPASRLQFSVRWHRMPHVMKGYPHAACHFVLEGVRTDGVKLGSHWPQNLSDRSAPDLKRADEAGFHWISVWDHFYANPLTERSAPCFEAVPSMASLASLTSRVRRRLHDVLYVVPQSWLAGQIRRHY